MATTHLAKIEKSRKSRPGARAMRARKYAIRTIAAFSAVCVTAIVMIYFEIDIPGAAWYFTGY